MRILFRAVISPSIEQVPEVQLKLINSGALNWPSMLNEPAQLSKDRELISQVVEASELKLLQVKEAQVPEPTLHASEIHLPCTSENASILISPEITTVEVGGQLTVISRKPFGPLKPLTVQVPEGQVNSVKAGATNLPREVANAPMDVSFGSLPPLNAEVASILMSPQVTLNGQVVALPHSGDSSVLTSESAPVFREPVKLTSAGTGPV